MFVLVRNFRAAEPFETWDPGEPVSSPKWISSIDRNWCFDLSVSRPLVLESCYFFLLFTVRCQFWFYLGINVRKTKGFFFVNLRVMFYTMYYLLARACIEVERIKKARIPRSSRIPLDFSMTVRFETIQWYFKYCYVPIFTWVERYRIILRKRWDRIWRRTWSFLRCGIEFHILLCRNYLKL